VHPGPLVELDFWAERSGNLASIHEQLSSERIKKVVKVLELANSPYHQAFQRLYQVCQSLLRRMCAVAGVVSGLLLVAHSPTTGTMSRCAAAPAGRAGRAAAGRAERALPGAAAAHV
jgi:hypothetical protein